MTIQMTESLSFQVQTEKQPVEARGVKNAGAESDQKFSNVMSKAQTRADHKVNKNNELEKKMDPVDDSSDLVREDSNEFSVETSASNQGVDEKPAEPVTMVEIDENSIHLNIPGMDMLNAEKVLIKDTEMQVTGNQLPSAGNHLPVKGFINLEALAKKVAGTESQIEPESTSGLRLPEKTIKPGALPGLESIQPEIMDADSELGNSVRNNIDLNISRNNVNLDINTTIAKIDDAGQLKAGLIATPAAVANPVTTSTPMVQVLQDMTLNPTGSSKVWGEGVGERVQWMVNQKLNSATIRLDPPHLGKLDVQINLAADATTININTQQAQTREMLEQASARLKEFLEESGFQNVNVDISHQQARQDEPSQAAFGSQSTDAEDGSQSVEAGVQNQGKNSVNGLVDYFA